MNGVEKAVNGVTALGTIIMHIVVPAFIQNFVQYPQLLTFWFELIPSNVLQH